MAAVVKVEKNLNEDDVKKVNEDLKGIQKKPDSTLTWLVSQLEEGIEQARESGVSWDDIAKKISEHTGTEIKSKSLRHAYTSYKRKQNNKDREPNDLTYFQLKQRYNATLKVLKNHNIPEVEIDKVLEESRKSHDSAKKNKNVDSKTVKKDKKSLIRMKKDNASNVNITDNDKKIVNDVTTEQKEVEKDIESVTLDKKMDNSNVDIKPEYEKIVNYDEKNNIDEAYEKKIENVNQENNDEIDKSDPLFFYQPTNQKKPQNDI